jgi:hypothetical protein
MNISQIIRKARIAADAIRIDATVSPLWGDEEMVDLVNEVADKMTAKLRLAGRHWLQKRMTSRDVTQTILGRLYNPINLQLSPNGFQLQLPPDCIEVLRITPVVDITNPGTQNVRFWPRDITDPTFIAADIGGQQFSNQIIPYGQSVFFYDLVGPLTIRFSPMATSTLDIELLYAARTSVLAEMKVGTVKVATGTTVTGFAQAGQDFQRVQGSAEFILGSTVSGQNPTLTPPTVDINRDYPPVSSINSATVLTLQDTMVDVAESTYILSSVPNVPPQHHRWMAMLVCDLMLRKVSITLALERFKATLQDWMETVQPDLNRARQSQEPTYTVPFVFEDF